MTNPQKSPLLIMEQAEREIRSARRNIGRAWRAIELAKLSLVRSHRVH